jgi:hypothetical protein
MNAEQTNRFPNELIGACKTIGPIGPPYQVIGPSQNGDGLTLARIVLLESGREEDYPIDDLIADPLAP